VARARIDGVELEGTYDAGNWFVMSSASFNRSEDLDSGDPLTDVAKVKTYLSAGVRVLDRKLTIAPNWQYVEPGEDSNYQAYNLFGLTVGWQPTEDVRAALVFNNLADTMYTPFLGDTAGPGFSVKGTLSVRLGAN
jgi:hemoglobin/transferrin/lactoferrin receptor protein